MLLETHEGGYQKGLDNYQAVIATFQVDCRSARARPSTWRSRRSFEIPKNPARFHAAIFAVV